MTKNYRLQNQEQDNRNNKITLSADLERAINDKLKYETVMQVTVNRQNESNYLEYYDTLTGTVIPDYNVNNELAFAENIFSAYGILGHSVTDKFKRSEERRVGKECRSGW